jgi:hypothetical protein
MSYHVPDHDASFDRAMDEEEREDVFREREATARGFDGRCEYAGCCEDAEYRCETCETEFCPDHGTKGGDRQVEDVGAVAYPSACWKCGGFNADKEPRR